jgi:hypothetical protein
MRFPTRKKFAEKHTVPWSLGGRAEVLDKIKPSIASAGLKEFDSEPVMILDSLKDYWV